MRLIDYVVTQTRLVSSAILQTAGKREGIPITWRDTFDVVVVAQFKGDPTGLC